MAGFTDATVTAHPQEDCINMARVGINPARGKEISDKPARITVAVLTYIPELSGYFENRLQILKLVLESLKKNTAIEHNLLVFDNGSCNEVTDLLLADNRAGTIDYLFLCERNIGKIDAFHFIFNAAPGEIVAYSDDDILFYPHWLEAQLEILEAFPKAGMVSGVPVRNASKHARTSLDKIVAEGAAGVSTSYEKRIPDDWEFDWANSTGRDPQTHLQATQDHRDLILRVTNPDTGRICEAIGSANHFQFIAPKQVILMALPTSWSGKLMGSMVELDEAIDQLGYLRLSTIQRYTRHLGNVLSQEVLREAQDMGLVSEIDHDTEIVFQPTPHQRLKKKHWLMHIPGSRRVLSAIYHRLFQILYK